MDKEKSKKTDRRLKWVARSGTEMVEFAIAFPLFCVMCLGTVEIGWLLYQQSLLDYATRQGARYASVDTANVLKPTGPFDISTQAEDVIITTVTGFGGQAPSRSAIYLKNPWPDDRTFTLIVEEPYTPVSGDLIPIISGINIIKSKTTMYCEACG